jgi:hypothetical protein
MTRALIVSGLLIAVAGCRRAAPAEDGRLANSEAVRVLQADDSPYRIIYNPAVDLAKQPVTSGPASPRRD